MPFLRSGLLSAKMVKQICDNKLLPLLTPIEIADEGNDYRAMLQAPAEFCKLFGQRDRDVRQRLHMEHPGLRGESSAQGILLTWRCYHVHGCERRSLSAEKQH